MEYLDFELRVSPGTGRNYQVLVVRSPAGETGGTMHFPFDALELEHELRGIEVATLRSASLRRDVVVADPTVDVVAQFGRQLFDALLPGSVLTALRRSQVRAQLDKKGLRLRLRIEAPDLAALPWELIFDPEANDYMCLSIATPLVRYIECASPPEMLTVEPPLRVLGVIARPVESKALDVEREKQRMQEATQDLQRAGLFTLDWLENSTARQLQQALWKHRYHILHFVGHGGFNAARGEGVLAFQEEDGKTALLSATELARLLADHPSLRLVVLNACLGARSSGTDIFSSTAAALVRRHVPAVIAMQSEISDQAALEFSRTLYEAIAHEKPVDEAVTEARKAMARHSVEWGTPVLHMRSPDGVLFKIITPVSPTPPLRPGHLDPPKPVVAPGPAPTPRPIWSAPALFAAAALLAALAAGVWCWDAFFAEHLDYYANVRQRWGFPEGIGHLSAADLSRRNASVVLVRRGRRHPAHEIRVVNSARNTPSAQSYFPLISVSHLNPLENWQLDDLLSSEAFQVTRVTFSPDAAGRLLEQAGFNRGGRRLYTIHFAVPEVGEYKREGFGTTVRESGIRYVKFARVATGPNAGLDEKVLYLDDQQRPQPDNSGAYGVRYVLNEMGLATEQINLGASETDHPTTEGILKSAVTYDHRGNILEAKSLDERGRLKAGQLGSPLVKSEFDGAGNLIQMSMYDSKGQLVVVEKSRWSTIRITYDAHGYVASQTFWGLDQKLTAGSQGFAKVTNEWQTATRSLQRFFDANEQPVPIMGGAFAALNTWDQNGYLTESAFRDEKGNATRRSDGCASVQLRYDKTGNVIASRCFDEQHAPSLTTDGSSSTQNTYDKFDQLTGQAYFDLHGAPGVVGDTYASVRLTYNPLGKVERVTYLNAQGNPVKTRAGYAEVTSEYDSSGDRIGQAFLDERGNRVGGVEGYSAIRHAFNERHLLVEEKFLDTRDRLVLSSDGHAIDRIDYDERGFATRVAYFGIDGKPARHADGYFSVRYKYDGKGRPFEHLYCDDKNNPMIAARFGSAIRRWTYDQNRTLERSDYDATGRLLVNAYGYSTMRFLYDQYGRENGRELLDIQGRKLPFKVSVDRIAPGSVAADVGLTVGDLILAYDGLAVTTKDQFANKLELFKADRARDLRIERNGQVLSLDLPAGRLQGLELAERVSGSRLQP